MKKINQFLNRKIKIDNQAIKSLTIYTVKLTVLAIIMVGFTTIVAQVQVTVQPNSIVYDKEANKKLQENLDVALKNYERTQEQIEVLKGIQTDMKGNKEQLRELSMLGDIVEAQKELNEVNERAWKLFEKTQLFSADEKVIISDNFTYTQTQALKQIELVNQVFEFSFFSMDDAQQIDLVQGALSKVLNQLNKARQLEMKYKNIASKRHQMSLFGKTNF